ncbi:MAG TPA: SagB/ThcOx family dehydrogenase, partial [Nitrospiria bacterium]|nr:SagB/ThcOx family dehydrogenase [Nitrospiria bacterium]
MTPDESLRQVFAYHEATKHHFHQYARGPHRMDWATQPDPFRRYDGARVVPLDHILPGDFPLYEQAFVEGQLTPRPFDRASVSQLFYDSLALSAWKKAGEVTWSLRVNPSSGNLHPTEGYLVCGPVAGLCDRPMVAHYAPREHALERRAAFSLETWKALAAGYSEEVLFVGLTSIHWREAWKYGERAFRYCQHDAGHAIAAVSLAAAGLGWKGVLLDGLPTDALADLLGVFDPRGAEPERPECLLAVYPQRLESDNPSRGEWPEALLAGFRKLHWEGKPNVLSHGHTDWPIIDHVAEATRKPSTRSIYNVRKPIGKALEVGSAPISFRRIIHQRRSAVALDGRTGITRNTFYQILLKTLPGPGQFPFNALPWMARVHLALFVHRVEGIDPGLYFLVRDPARKEELRAALKKEFAWERPEGCPEPLELYRLQTGDARSLSEQVSCHQEIAADGCFSLGMIAEFERSLEEFGAWFYPKLFWECGAVGQVLYLEAEASGIRGTGIGCFFDDPVHAVLGFEDKKYQSLYHFTMGGPVEDPRLTTLPAYPDRETFLKSFLGLDR